MKNVLYLAPIFKVSNLLTNRFHFKSLQIYHKICHQMSECFCPLFSYFSSSQRQSIIKLNSNNKRHYCHVFLMSLNVNKTKAFAKHSYEKRKIHDLFTVEQCLINRFKKLNLNLN